MRRDRGRFDVAWLLKDLRDRRNNVSVEDADGDNGGLTRGRLAEELEEATFRCFGNDDSSSCSSEYTKVLEKN